MYIFLIKDKKKHVISSIKLVLPNRMNKTTSQLHVLRELEDMIFSFSLILWLGI